MSVNYDKLWGILNERGMMEIEKTVFECQLIKFY